MLFLVVMHMLFLVKILTTKSQGWIRFNSKERSKKIFLAFSVVTAYMALEDKS